jgi:hypothetical protein
MPTCFIGPPRLGETALVEDVCGDLKALRRTEPDPSAGWDRKVQKLLLLSFVTSRCSVTAVTSHNAVVGAVFVPH